MGPPTRLARVSGRRKSLDFGRKRVKGRRRQRPRWLANTPAIWGRIEDRVGRKREPVRSGAVQKPGQSDLHLPVMQSSTFLALLDVLLNAVMHACTLLASSHAVAMHVPTFSSGLAQPSASVPQAMNSVRQLLCMHDEHLALVTLPLVNCSIATTL